MRVTDCGCFGDFLKLEPTVSFYKDVFVLMPITLYFVFKHKDFAELLPPLFRKILVWGTILLATIFCLRNAFFDEPVVDFRPFRNGVNIRTQKEAEEKAAGAQKIISRTLKNDKTGQEITVMEDEYLKDYATKYNKDDGWKQIGEPERTPLTVAHSKISDFALNDVTGADVTDSLLNERNYMFIVASWKMLSTNTSKTIQVQDSVFTLDTLNNTRTFDRVEMKEEIFKSFSFDAEYRWLFTSKINPFMEKAEKAGYKIAGLMPFSEPKKIQDFRHDVQAAYPFYTADDLVIKTMIRSNPGVYLLKNGLIVHKWHINQLPDFEKVKAEFIK